MKLPDKLKFSKVQAIVQDLYNERSEWEAEWRKISDFILPGRGIYQTYNKPRKRKLTSPSVINTAAEDALTVLSSGLHGRLSSPAMPWFRYTWADPRIKTIEALVAWLQQSEKIVQGLLHNSQFYSVLSSFYTEYAGYGNGSMYVGESDDSNHPYDFHLLTAGEYSYAIGPDGQASVFVRTIFMSPRQMVEEFGTEKVSEDIALMVENNKSGVDRVDLAVIEVVCRYENDDKNFIRVTYEVTGTNRQGTAKREPDQQPLRVDGFYEHPYPTARWAPIGSDTYGIGPGARSLTDVQRLQEMEKAFLMAVHKDINPPINAPAKMRGKLNTLPGGYNYYSNPNETITELYRMEFNYQGVSAAIERVEQRIQRNYFNDVFLTASRDPDASPLRTGQVNAQQQEQMFRLGPIVESLQYEFFVPILRRCFKIAKRRGLLPPLPPELEVIAGEFDVTIISPLAVAQRRIKAQGVDAFMGFVGQAAQFDQTILDNIDTDAAARDRAEIEGVDYGILRTTDDVARIRKERAAALRAQQEQEQQAAVAQVGSKISAEQAQAQKAQAEAGKILGETQQISNELGI